MKIAKKTNFKNRQSKTNSAENLDEIASINSFNSTDNFSFNSTITAESLIIQTTAESQNSSLIQSNKNEAFIVISEIFSTSQQTKNFEKITTTSQFISFSAATYIALRRINIFTEHRNPAIKSRKKMYKNAKIIINFEKNNSTFANFFDENNSNFANFFNEISVSTKVEIIDEKNTNIDANKTNNSKKISNENETITTIFNSRNNDFEKTSISSTSKKLLV